MGVIPCGHRLVLKLVDLKEVDKAYDVGIKGFEIVGSDKQRREEAVDVATVLAIGPTAFRDFCGDAWCAVGDRVAIARYAGKKVTDLDGTAYQVVNDEDIVCVIKGTE